MDEKTKKLIQLDKQFVWHPFTQMADWLDSDPLIIESGRGFYLIDTEQNRYIDAVSSLWCNVHGHNVKHIDDAIKLQLEKISHSTLLGLAQTRSIELAEKLINIAPQNLKKVFYSDSGATAVEIAIKMAYQYFQNIGQPERKKFIALEESYHGDTIGSVSVGGIGTFHSIFRSLLFETFFAPSPHPYRFDGSTEDCMNHSLEKIENILKTNPSQIAAIILEPLVQGAGGILVHPKGFLKAVRVLADKFGVLLIVDEVATGFGKTGKMFACQNENVNPDIMCIAKGISAGYLPLAATLTTQQIFDGFLIESANHKTFYHGHTYTGNALACAAAIASLELFEKNKIIESMPEKIQLLEKHLEKIEQLPYIGSVRNAGIMTGIEIVKDKKTKLPFPAEQKVAAKLCAAMRKKGLIARPLSDVLVLMPPVAINLELLEEMLNIVTDSIKAELPKIVKDI